MGNQTTLHKIFHFFLVKIILGIFIIIGLVFLVEWSGKLFLDQTRLTDSAKRIIIAIADSIIALFSYIFIYKAYEKRQINELSLSTLGKNAAIGVAAGFSLQSVFILVIYLAGGYSIVQVNPVSFLILPFSAALTAGFVAEILILGVFFRITEEWFGTTIALVIISLLFAILHINANGATVLSVCSTGVEAGFMLSAVYVATRNLWLPIFLHFGWDFTEPGIYGAFNPGISERQTLFTSKITGSTLLTGGITGPQNSIQALIICSLTGILLLWIAKRNNKFIQPCWIHQPPNNGFIANQK
jgi:membrane protease YdiL (CAAX protease family)